MPATICLAFTGASGMPYGLRLLECLLAAGCRVQLLYSQVAQIVARQEIGLELPARASEARASLQQRYATLPGTLEVYGREEWFAPLASGSNPPDAMVVCPCSMGTLAAIAQGLASRLIERAAEGVAKQLDPDAAGLKLEIVAEAARNPRVAQIVELGDHHTFIAEVTNVHIHNRPEGRPDEAVLEMKDLGEKVFYGG